MRRNLIMFSKFDKITLANWWLSQQNIIWIHQVDQTVTLFLLFKPRATDIFFLVFNVVFSYQSNNQRDVKLLTTGNHYSKWQQIIPQETADLVTFTVEICNEKAHFCTVYIQQNKYRITKISRSKPLTEPSILSVQLLSVHWNN